MTQPTPEEPQAPPMSGPLPTGPAYPGPPPPGYPGLPPPGPSTRASGALAHAVGSAAPPLLYVSPAGSDSGGDSGRPCG